ncbi:ArnT family glycosyltransferase [Niabella insulamsoli]|uniref:ArnT family glycosyltransferase n=1 Tax=Niabella insulamsoli TaxID=3144874 RepID=UPI0031FC0F89
MRSILSNSSNLPPEKENKVLVYLMLCWFVINALQAHFLGLEGDEAYYWHLSQNIDWSYFDHPPMVALLIRIGESFGHGSFFTRLGTVLITTLSVGIIYKALPERLSNMKWYILVAGATLLLNVYSFITTPDAPLLFFAALFLLTYKRFLAKNSIGNSLLMALCITGMFYSKYHGILLVGFVVLSNLKMLTNRYFWLTVLITTLLFLPHLFWQYQHDWPSFRYHLNERLARHYRINYTTDYLLGQILVFGPFISLLFYATCYKLKIREQLIKTHLFIFAGTLIFFFISSFKNTVEAHWTLIAVPSFITLFMALLTDATDRYIKLFQKFAIANIAIILLARILFLVPHSPFTLIRHYYPFFYGKEWAATLHRAIGDTPVVFENSYVLPSLYKYYFEEVTAIDYNTKGYRKTNYNLEDDCLLSGQKVWHYQMTHERDSALAYIDTKYNPGKLYPINQFTCVNALKIAPLRVPTSMKPGAVYPVALICTNKSNHPVTIYNPLSIDYAFFIAKSDFINAEETYPLPKKMIQASETLSIPIQLKAPEQPGTYKLLFSIKNESFAGNFASAFFTVKIE